MSDSNTAQVCETTLSSSAVEGYHAQRLERIRTQVPVLLEKLKRQGVARITAHYDGSGDRGVIEEVCCLDDHGTDIAIGVVTLVNVADLFVDLLETRYCLWQDGDGSDGELSWLIDNNTLSRRHRERFIDHRLSEHTGV